MSALIINEKEIKRAVSLLKPDNGLFEIRFIGNSGRLNFSGYFTNADRLIECLKRLAPSEPGNVYIALNAINTACYSRSQHDCFVKNPKTTTSDNDITAYNWLMLDFDPTRPSGTSSSNDELEIAHQKARKVYEYLKDKGFHEPIKAMSGNGYHLLYKIDLENNEEHRELIKRVLETLDTFFSDSKLKVDTKVFNPSRICKLYGTKAVKGADTAERPHRMAQVLSSSEDEKNIETNPKELLTALVAKLPKDPDTTQQKRSHNFKNFDLSEWITRHNINITETVPLHNYGTKYILEECPFDSNHRGKDACLIQLTNGAVSFHCFHDSCSKKGWKDFRVLFEPNAYLPKPEQVTRSTRIRPIPTTKTTAQENESEPDTIPEKTDMSKYIQLSTVESTKTEWLWYPYIPLGKITLMTADPGTGKTFFSLCLASQISTGRPFYGQELYNEPGVVVYQTAEDGIADTLKPRLEPMKPNFENIYIFNEEKESLSLSDEKIEQIMKDLHPKLMIFDPLQAYLGADVDMHRANEVRPVLGRIGHLAEKYKCSVLFIMHNSKMSQNTALHRALGSIDIPAVARSMLILGKNPDNPNKGKIMCHEKSSLAPHGKSILFEIDPSLGGIVFSGFSDLKADDILNVRSGTRNKPSTTRDEIADELLTEYFGENDHIILPSIKSLCEELECSRGTLYNARDELQLQCFSVGYGKEKMTYWVLPDVDIENFKQEHNLCNANDDLPF